MPVGALPTLGGGGGSSVCRPFSLSAGAPSLSSPPPLPPPAMELAIRAFNDSRCACPGHAGGPSDTFSTVRPRENLTFGGIDRRGTFEPGSVGVSVREAGKPF